MAMKVKKSVDDYIKDMMDMKTLHISITMTDENDNETTDKINIETDQTIGSVLAAKMVQAAIEGGVKDRALLLDRAYGKSKVTKEIVKEDKRMSQEEVEARLKELTGGMPIEICEMPIEIGEMAKSEKRNGEISNGEK